MDTGGKFIKSIYFVVLLSFLGRIALSAQVPTFSCDFENEAENAQWNLNLGRMAEDCKNKWYIGTAVNNGGQSSLYISCDEGVNAGYQESSMSIAGARSMLLAQGDYILNFDWQAMGYNGKDALYVCWMPDSVFSNSNSGSSELPNFVKKYALTFNGTETRLYNSTWNSSFDTINSDGVTLYKLVFVWNNKVGAVVSPAACIDNIEIFPLNSCPLPQMLNVEAGDGCAVASWNGGAESYDVRCKSSTSDEWKIYNDYQCDSLIVNDLGEGVYSLYVRAGCGDGHSPWVSCEKFVFFRGVRCVDYMDLENSTCLIGKIRLPDMSETIVDFGYKDMFSRHTVHYQTQERDAQTLGLLQTVPDGELASVRLGNWNVNSEKESIEYDYAVDTAENAILLLKYAVVVQDPGHDKDEQPRFTLEVLKQDGSRLDDYGCAEADFFAGKNTTKEEGWHQTPGDPKSCPPLWKEWTTVGINLKEYHNQVLKIRLTTYDCSQDGHYGYAYFTLGCSDGKIISLSCGESDKNSFKAPDGFKYRWYKKDDLNKTVLDSAQIFTTHKSDTAIYCCDVIQPTKGECYYTVEANATPRYPVADGSYEAKVEKCNNIVSFTDKSYVKHVNPKTGEVTIADTRPDSVAWNFGDGSPIVMEANPKHSFPQQGGKFTVSLSAYLAAECIDVKTFQLELPALSDMRQVTTAYACEGTPYSFRGHSFTSDTLYVDTVYGVCQDGCDSIFVLDLKFSKDTTIYISDTICQNKLPYIIDGIDKEYWHTGQYTETLTSSLFGCDSVIQLDLLVVDSLKVMVDYDNIETCGDSIRIPFSVVSGLTDSYSLVFSNEFVNSLIGCTSDQILKSEIVIEKPRALKPGSYDGTIVFGDVGCGDMTIPLTLEIYYPDSIIAQRWNDVLGVRNSLFNGGYDFISYQWYKNNSALAGQNEANLYDGNTLDPDAVYTVLLTRTDDGVSQFTCPFQPTIHGDIEVDPTVVFGGGYFYVRSDVPCIAKIWSVSGLLISVDYIPNGVCEVAAPSVPGVYILEIIQDNGWHKVTKVSVVGQ